MEEMHETEVERDADGRIVGYKQHIERPRGGGLGWGILLGVAIVAIGIGIFAYNQGSFQTAGRQADRATIVAQERIGEAAHETADAVDTAGDRAQQAANQTRERTN